MADTIFSTAWTRMLQDVCKSTIALFLGGVHFLLAVAVFYLFSRRNTNGRVVFMCAIAVMLFLAIAELVIQLIVTSLSMRLLYWAGTPDVEPISLLKQQASLERLYNIMVSVENFILVTNNAVADALFAYRCYHIWGKYNKAVICIPVLLLLLTMALGYVTIYSNDILAPGAHIADSRIGFTFAIVTNLVLTGLTAGRIWWTKHDLRVVGQDKYAKRYTNAISVLLESGAMYCLSLILIMLALSFGRKATSGTTAIFRSLAYGAAGQLLNIIPTLFIVRICLSPPAEPDKGKSLV